MSPGSQSACPFCQAKSIPAFQARVLGKYIASYETCTGCGSLHVVKPHWLAEAYANPGRADALDGGAAWRNEILARVTEAVGTVAPPGPWLDYGCGQGLLVDRLRAKGFMITGYDPYRGGGFIHPSGYCMITSFEVLEHQVEPETFLNEVWSKMRPSGLLILSTCLRQPQHGSGWGYLALSGGQHVSFASSGGLDALVRRCRITRWGSWACRENEELQVHILSDRDAEPVIFDKLDGCGFVALR